MTREISSKVKTTESSLQIIELIASNGPVTGEFLENRSGLTTSTIHRHLSTLREHNYVIKEEGKYNLGYKFLTIGGQLRRKVKGYPMIKQKVDDLADETDERAQFIVQEGQERVYLYTEIGNNPVQTGADTGRREPVYASAAGKAILADLSKRKRDRLFESFSLKGTGPNTITDLEELRDNLDEIRDRGYALNIEESTTGVHAIGASVMSRENDAPIGAISISGPATRLKLNRIENDLVDLVLGATNELELHIEHS